MAIDNWAAARPFFGKAPSYVVSKEDQDRLRAYELYENMFRISPDVFKLVQRGEDTAPIYLPAPKKCINAINRFFMKDWDYVVSPRVGDPQDQLTVAALLSKLFKREKMYAKFNTQKLYGLVRGDKVWHIHADDTKPEGSRVSIDELSPANYFPITELNNIDNVLGCHIVDIVIDPNDPDKTKTLARRQTYRKDPVSEIITSQLAYFEVDAWDDRNLKETDIKLVQEIWDKPLPPEIKTIPVYHVKNNRAAGQFWGWSDLDGFARVFGAANQGISDEEQSLAMMGIGMFVTTAGPPTNEDGTVGEWVIGPGQVVELPSADDKFESVTGVSSTAPMLDHIRFLLDEVYSSMGLSDVALGRMDTATAESGISLALQLAPLIAHVSDKESEDLAVMDQMLYNLVHEWFAAFEGIPADIAVEVLSVTGDPIPTDRAAKIAEIVALATSTPPLITVAEARAELMKLDYDLPTNQDGTPSSDEIIKEQAALSQARFYDPLVNRFASELDVEGVQQNLGSTGSNVGPTPVVPTAIPVAATGGNGGQSVNGQG